MLRLLQHRRILQQVLALFNSSAPVDSADSARDIGVFLTCIAAICSASGSASCQRCSHLDSVCPALLRRAYRRCGFAFLLLVFSFPVSFSVLFLFLCRVGERSESGRRAKRLRLPVPSL